ncbi:MAG: hypothetical protein IJG60_00250 [Thermoguttaceae bacterium]|nr:hypothetical protein [Thermoguttaceae bacterium]
MCPFRKENRLTPFEEYMFWDETPAFPMSSWQKLRFSGRLDLDLLRESLAAAALRHPLMTARVALVRGKPYWELRDKEPEIVPFENAGDEKILPMPDIRNASGLKVYYRAYEEEGRERTDLCFAVHHSVSDGVGILGFMEEIFLNYAARKGSAIPPEAYPEISADSMAERQAPQQTWRRYFKLLTYGIKSTRNMLLHDAKPFLPIKKIDYDTPNTRPVLYDAFTLSRQETRAYIAEAKKRGWSLNDLLMRDFFVSCGDFERKFVPKLNRWIRVAMPIDMRTRETPPLFAANVVSMVFLDRRPSQITGGEEFGEGIHRETQWIKKTDQGYTLLVNLRSKRNTFGGLKIVLHGRRCWSTTVLSNLGIIFGKTPLPRTEDGRLIVGDTVLDSFCGMPPVRAKTFTGWGVWTYAGRLGLAMRYDERYLSDEQSAFAFGACRDHVTATIGGAGAARQ